MVGQTISHYKITEKLGEGGMGVVYKAEDTKLKRSGALKFPAPHLLQDEEARKRFEREATAAAGLSHPNICTVYEISDEGGETFLAMEFIEGESLDNKSAFSDAVYRFPGGRRRQVHDVVHHQSAMLAQPLLSDDGNVCTTVWQVGHGPRAAHTG